MDLAVIIGMVQYTTNKSGCQASSDRFFVPCGFETINENPYISRIIGGKPAQAEIGRYEPWERRGWLPGSIFRRGPLIPSAVSIHIEPVYSINNNDK